MHAPRKFLAGAALAENQYRDIRRRDFPHDPADFEHRLIGGDHPGERRV